MLDVAALQALLKLKQKPVRAKQLRCDARNDASGYVDTTCDLVLTSEHALRLAREKCTSYKKILKAKELK